MFLQPILLLAIIAGVHSIGLLPLPRLIPIRYDVQLQLPTASEQDPLVPTFFGSAKLEFQLTRSLPSPADPRDSAGSIRLTFLAQQLDQFTNVTLAQSGREEDQSFQLDVEVKPPREVDFVVPLADGFGTLVAGRYTLDIGRFQGTISYDKGVLYRDAGGLPLLGSDFFYENSPSLFPQLGGPLQKTTTKISLIHPQGSTALSSMPSLGPTESLNEHWRLTRFVQAPNVAAYLLAIAVLPDSVYERTVVQSEPPLLIWTNRLLHRPTLKQELAKLSVAVFEIVSQLLGSEQQQLPVSSLNLLAVDDFNGTQSFGLIALSLSQWEASDEAHRIALLARQFGRQWLGGMTTVASSRVFCLQEDLVEWLAQKAVKQLLTARKAEKAWQRFQLAHYLRMHLAETFLSPGESVALPEWAGLDQMANVCGLKGVQLLNSLERLTSEETMLSTIRQLLTRQRYRNFRLEHFTELLRPLLVDNIDLGQVFDFWFKSGGIPNLLVEKREDRLRLLQLNEGRQAQLNADQWAKMPLLPLPISIRNVTLPFKFMLSQVLELAPLDRKLLPLTNLGFEHLYRVNYDRQGWERIFRDLDATSLAQLDARTRAQLLGDFCYFSAIEQIEEEDRRLQQPRVLDLLREHFEHFELCEFYTFWCTAGQGKRIPMDQQSRAKYAEVLRRAVWPALLDGANYECGGPGAAFDAANELCHAAFDRNCF